jgi:ketosteroid isomerase-like protein
MTDRRALLLSGASLPLMSATTQAQAQAQQAPAAWPDSAEIARRTEQVRAAEIAFAATMAARDLKAFRSFLAADTVFYGRSGPLVGPDVVVAAWTAFFEGPTPPFSWAPDLALVLPSGDLARTSGPVHDPAGQLVSRFQTTWRRKADGGWEVVFDFGSKA